MIRSRLILEAAALPLLLAAAGPAQERPAARILPAPAGAQPQPSQEDLVRRRDEKLALPAFKKPAWTFDYDAARAEAKKSGKLIFTYFSRSYAH
jgi:hypothetical protein